MLLSDQPTPDFTIEDYIAALDNLSKLHVAVVDEKKELEARNTHLMGAIATLTEQAKVREDTISDLRGRIETLNDLLSDLRQTPLGLQRDIESLVAARYSFRSGNMSDGMYELEKVLSAADSAWHTRSP